MSQPQAGSSLQTHRRMLRGPAHGEPADAELLRRYAATRDEAAFTELLGRHAGLVWGVCRRLLPREQDAEDAFQATFLVLAERAGSIRRAQSVGSWLHGVAHRIAVRAGQQGAGGPDRPRPGARGGRRGGAAGAPGGAGGGGGPSAGKVPRAVRALLPGGTE